MTTQRRTLVSPSDIVAIEYECTKCAARYSVGLSKVDQLLRKCPNCATRWFDETEGRHNMVPRIKTGEGSDDAVMASSIESLQRLRTLKCGAIIRFEIIDSLPEAD